MIKWTLPIACAFVLSACGAMGMQDRPEPRSGAGVPETVSPEISGTSGAGTSVYGTAQGTELPERTGTAGLEQVDPASGAGVPERVSPEGVPMDAAEEGEAGRLD